MAKARYGEADLALKRTSEEMEWLSSATSHMKLAMEYGLAISEVRCRSVLLSIFLRRRPSLGQLYRKGVCLGREIDFRRMFFRALMDYSLKCLQRCAELPKEYASLKDVALKCIYNVRFDGDARDVFKTPRVQEALNDVMTLTIKALECIAIYYSKSKLSKCMLVISMMDYSFAIENV